MAVAPAARPYRAYLTTALHRRLINISLWIFVLCYFEAVWMAEPSLFWSWFPLSWTGTRALLLFIVAFLILIMRMGQLHIGTRTTPSPFETSYQFLFRSTTISTLFMYTLSAWLFSEVYIWSAPESANLGWIDPGRAYERERLNERPLLFRKLFLFLAAVQTGVHLYRDYDRVDFLPKDSESALEGQTKVPDSPRAHLLDPSWIRAAAASSCKQVGWMVVPSTFLYFVITPIRNLGWSSMYWFFKQFHSLPKAPRPTGVAPLPELIGRFMVEAFLLTFLWEFVNAAFNIFWAQEPLKVGRPLTDSSVDPNGSLLNGLKSKSDMTKTTAFWELAIITQRFQDRRAAIFADIERKNGSAWSQICTVGLAEVKAIVDRINGTASQPEPHPESARPLPKISAPLHQDDILNPRASQPSGRLAIVSKAGVDLAKSYSRPHGNGSPFKMVAETRLLPPAARQSAEARGRSLRDELLRSPVGVFFRKTFARRATTLVCGTPYSSLDLSIFAIESLVQLSLCSLKEDKLGLVAPSIPSIIRAFTEALEAIENYLNTLQPHWTDLEFGEKERTEARKVPEVDLLRARLRGGLEKLLGGFGEYTSSLGMTDSEVRHAKDMVARGRAPEMVQQ